MTLWASVEDDVGFAEPDNSSQAGQAKVFQLLKDWSILLNLPGRRNDETCQAGRDNRLGNRVFGRTQPASRLMHAQQFCVPQFSVPFEHTTA